jgi:hypothetical protein
VGGVPRLNACGCCSCVFSCTSDILPDIISDNFSESINKYQKIYFWEKNSNYEKLGSTVNFQKLEKIIGKFFNSKRF